jgi:two-component system OmpR family sensor kinase
VWYGDGREMSASANAPPMEFEEVPALVEQDTAAIRGRRHYREAFMRGPRGSVVMVGRSIRREQGELNQWRWLLLGAGGGALAIGVIGGSWLTRRALRPLQQMSQAAAAISSADWSARIDTARIDVELATLAHTLNDAFDRLEADFQKQARFTADASHELRTPLTVILGHLDLALTQGTPDPASRDAMNACLRAARRMKSLIEQLLLLARADAGKLTTQHVRLDFGEAVEECIDLLRPMARDKQVVLQATVKPVDVIGDPSLLAQVAINLITNAIQHNEPGGTVNVTVSSDKHSVRLVVADTGLGISEAAQARLFERFYRADAARSRATGGAGLGLAITQSIVRAHGGEITCTSREGQGSEFVVTLPLDAPVA